jgi:hypothetical protein
MHLNWQTRPQPTPNPVLVNYYIFDGRGSVRALTDGIGNVTETYDYDAFGNLLHTSFTGSAATPNNYLFAGEQFDPDLGLWQGSTRCHWRESARAVPTAPGRGDTSPLTVMCTVGRNSHEKAANHEEIR